MYIKKIFCMGTAAAAALLLGSCGTPIDETPVIPVDLTVTSEETTAETTQTETEAAVTEITEIITTQTEPEPEPPTVHFLAAGDNLVHGSIYRQAQRRSENGGYDFGYEYANAAETVAAADIAMINQETLICNDEYPPSDYPHFNSPVALGDHMIDIGFDVFTIANNHMLDQGANGLSACLDYWESRPEAVVAGAYRNKEDAERIRTFESEGIVFSFLAYTESTNGAALPSSSELVIGSANYPDDIVTDIKAAKEISDICVVSLHWGIENSDEVTDKQRERARMYAEAGADIIVGTHPHVLRQIEVIENPDGRNTVCAYSLGNFASAQNRPQNMIGGLLELDVIREEEGYLFENITLTPVIQHYDAKYSNNRIYLYSQYSEELASQHGVIGEGGAFSMEFIDSVLDKNIGEEYLKLN